MAKLTEAQRAWLQYLSDGHFYNPEAVVDDMPNILWIRHVIALGSLVGKSLVDVQIYADESTWVFITEAGRKALEDNPDTSLYGAAQCGPGHNIE
ncbi:MAG: hypothetical protein ACR2QH_01650 [Geminicoccaceae bacterium]